MSRDYLIARATSRETSSSCDGGEGESPFPHGTWTHCEAPSCVEPQCTQEFVAEKFPLLCPKPKVMPCFSPGDVVEARWLSHRWIDTSPILPDAAHDSRIQGRVVSVSALSVLSACVRLRQLREVHHSLQQSSAESQWSPTQGSATDGSLAGCTSLMLRVWVMLRVYYPLNPPCVRYLCCCCANCGVHPVWPVLSGAL